MGVATRRVATCQRAHHDNMSGSLLTHDRSDCLQQTHVAEVVGLKNFPHRVQFCLLNRRPCTDSGVGNQYIKLATVLDDFSNSLFNRIGFYQVQAYDFCGKFFLCNFFF